MHPPVCVCVWFPAHAGDNSGNVYSTMVLCTSNTVPCQPCLWQYGISPGMAHLCMIPCSWRYPSADSSGLITRVTASRSGRQRGRPCIMCKCKAHEYSVPSIVHGTLWQAGNAPWLASLCSSHWHSLALKHVCKSALGTACALVNACSWILTGGTGMDMSIW